MKALQLEDVIRDFKNQHPLTPDNEDQWEAFYTDTRRDVIHRMATELLCLETGHQLLFGGQKGNGKSTELNRLINSDVIKSNFFIIPMDLKNLLNFNDIDIVDLLLAVCVLLLDFTHRNGIVIENRLIKEFEKMETFFRDTLLVGQPDARSCRPGPEMRKLFSMDTELPLICLCAMLFTRMKDQPVLRKTLRDTLHRRTGELVELINELIVSIHMASGKNACLLVIDGLERISYDQAGKIFYDHGQVLSNIHQASCVFTAPIGIIHSDKAHGVEQMIGPIYTLNNLRLKTPKGFEDRTAEAHRQVMEYFFCNRAEYNLITESGLKLAVDFSLGNFSEMMTLVGTAAVNSLSRGDTRIHESDMKEAVHSKRLKMLRPMNEQLWRILLEIHENNFFISCSETQRVWLIENSYVIEYSDENGWFYVNPLLIPAVLKFKKYLRRPAA